MKKSKIFCSSLKGWSVVVHGRIYGCIPHYPAKPKEIKKSIYYKTYIYLVKKLQLASNYGHGVMPIKVKAKFVPIVEQYSKTLKFY